MAPQIEFFSFVFWGELKTLKRHFETNWPLDAALPGLSCNKTWVQMHGDFIKSTPQKMCRGKKWPYLAQQCDPKTVWNKDKIIRDIFYVYTCLYFLPRMRKIKSVFFTNLFFNLNNLNLQVQIFLKSRLVGTRNCQC